MLLDTENRRETQDQILRDFGVGGDWKLHALSLANNIDADVWIQ